MFWPSELKASEIGNPGILDVISFGVCVEKGTSFHVLKTDYFFSDVFPFFFFLLAMSKKPYT